MTLMLSHRLVVFAYATASFKTASHPFHRIHGWWDWLQFIGRAGLSANEGQRKVWKTCHIVLLVICRRGQQRLGWIWRVAVASIQNFGRAAWFWMAFSVIKLREIIYREDRVVCNRKVAERGICLPWGICWVNRQLCIAWPWNGIEKRDTRTWRIYIRNIEEATKKPIHQCISSTKLLSLPSPPTVFETRRGSQLRTPHTVDGQATLRSRNEGRVIKCMW